MMNIISTFVPNELITCYDRDPLWKYRYIKCLIVAINDFHEFFFPSSIMDNLFIFKHLQDQLIQT